MIREMEVTGLHMETRTNMYTLDLYTSPSKVGIKGADKDDAKTTKIR
jgi:hypothetical protein